MPRAAELKSGMLVTFKDQPWIVRQVQAHNPSARGASTLYKVRFNHASTGQKHDESFKGDDLLPEVDYQRRAVQFLYQDAEGYTFMDLEDYSQHLLTNDQLGDQAAFLSDGLAGITALIIEDVCVTVQLPTTVDLTITETAPAMKGASQSARNKPATLNTGLEIQVPEYVEVGTLIKVNTETKEFGGRV